MGAVDLVPGISAGTIAFVTGIYEQLIHSIKSFNLDAIKTLKDKGLAAAWRHINGEFLLILISGILFSLFTLAGDALFFRDISAAAMVIFYGFNCSLSHLFTAAVSTKKILEIGLLVAGILASYSLSVATINAVEGNYLSVFLAGSVALCAMILPGISGSFILVLLGLYPVFINALVNIELDFLLIFAAGGIGV